MNIFRSVRKKLAAENKFPKYMRYAIGEIALIIVGILLALQIQIWNENKKQDAHFRDVMNKVYTALQDDLNNINRTRDFLMFSIYACDTILDDSKAIGPMDRIYLTFNSYNDAGNSFGTEVEFYRNYFNNQFKKEWQNSIAIQIFNYLKVSENSWKESTVYTYKNKIDYLLEHDITYPRIDENNVNNGFDLNDENYYTGSQLERFEELRKSDGFRTAILSYRSSMIIKRQALFSLQSEVQSLIANIKIHYPEVKILFQNVGLIGTSLDGFDDVGGHSTPMIETNAEKSIWEQTFYLKKGRVKFRCNDSWTLNWGAPFGESEHLLSNQATKDGADIPIEEEGNYHITLNLTDFTYTFKKLEN